MEDRVAGRTQDEVMLEAVRTVAEYIQNWLRFTADHLDNHDNKTVPMLDLKVWVRHPRQQEEEGGHDTLGWSFYEKPSI